MNLKTLLKIFSGKNCKKVYVKRLAENDNSKNQVYLGGSFDVLNIFPSSPSIEDRDGTRKRETFKSKLDFFWVHEDGSFSHAPYAQLILYPDYPEVRFSGFLKSCRNAPSQLLRSRVANRILFLAVSEDKKIYGFVTVYGSELANEFNSKKNLETHGFFSIITITNGEIVQDSKSILLNELKRIHNLSWICSKRLRSVGEIVPCNSSNCGGYTLEAELGIPSNSVAGPDFLGWEIKQFRVPNFERFGSTSVTLMDHSPTDGFYSEKGPEAFIRKYGYDDKLGRKSRINFGGSHKYELVHTLTSLRLMQVGFDPQTRTIFDNHGFVGLIDDKNNLAAAWSFKSIIDHWKVKHPLACYVPAKMRKGEFQNCYQQYWYGNKVLIGRFTDVSLFLYELCQRNVFYDPGIKLEMAIVGERAQTIKIRSVFRTKPAFLPSLYFENEIVDINSI